MKNMKNKIANLFIASVWILTFVGMLWAFSIGAYVEAYRLLGTLIIMSLILLMVWIGMKKGWSEKTWKIICILMIIAGIIIGIYVYFYLSNQSLTERTLSIEGKEISILVPKNLGHKETIKNAFGRKGQDISGLAVSVFKLSSLEARDRLESASCSDLSQTIAFTVNISPLNKDFDICSNSGNPGETELYLAVFDELNIYTIMVIARDEYLSTVDGKEKLKRIFESFSIHE